MFFVYYFIEQTERLWIFINEAKRSNVYEEQNLFVHHSYEIPLDKTNKWSFQKYRMDNECLSIEEQASTFPRNLRNQFRKLIYFLGNDTLFSYQTSETRWLSHPSGLWHLLHSPKNSNINQTWCNLSEFYWISHSTSNYLPSQEEAPSSHVVVCISF